MNAAADKARGQSQRRLLKVVTALAGHEFSGVTLAEITAALSEDKANVHRDLQVLEDEGWAERLPDSTRWRLAPRMVQLALAFQRELAKAESRVAELQQRYTRER